MRRGTRFNDLSVGDLIHPQTNPPGVYRVMRFTRIIDGEIHVALKHEAGGLDVERTLSQLTKTWRKL